MISPLLHPGVEFALDPADDDDPAEPAGWRAPAPAGAAALCKMKYIRHRKIGFVLFEGSIAHAEIASRLGGAGEIVSAGFVIAPGFDLKCLGYSGTLNLGAGPADAADLRRRMGAV